MIKNYRSFKLTSVDFHEGINLIIGQNNAGKSNLLKALAIIFNDNVSRQLNIEDFYSGTTLEELKQHSPKISISITFKQSNNEELEEDELVTVSNWLVSLSQPYEAKLTYEFFLPDEYEDKYIKQIVTANKIMDAWKIIDKGFIRLYIHKIWAGDINNQVSADVDSLNKFDFQFLDAIRDVEHNMTSGKNTLLKKIIDFFIDYDIKSNSTLTEDQQAQEIEKREDTFQVGSNALIQSLQDRLKSGKTEILAYASNIGASFDGVIPDFKGTLKESELYSVLQLIVKQRTGMDMPVTNNGLGYNNLIFMSLLLAKMQVDSNGSYLGSNAKVFPILAVEEPEAHLHPTMQFQVIKFLKDNIKAKKVKQVFITSHSTHITSSVSLDDIICLYRLNEQTKICYPGKVFYSVTNSNEDASKKYVQRFLDATKSNMLFSEKIIFVEGMAEQLLIPIFAKYLGKDLEEQHVSIINIGGRYFKHFLYLFDDQRQDTIHRKIACITDIDPVRKKKNGNDTKFRQCYPYEIDLQDSEYEYDANHSMDDYKIGKRNLICSFSQDENYGKTLEYQIAYENYLSRLLFVPSLKNQEELSKLIDKAKNDNTIEDMFHEMRASDENTRIKEGIKRVEKRWDDEKRKRALIASRYLNSVEKGVNALELASELSDNLAKEPTEQESFNVPAYIKQAIEWVCD